MKLTKAGEGKQRANGFPHATFSSIHPRAIWRHGRRAPAPRVWVKDLMTFEPDSGKTTAVTWVGTNDVQPSICGK
jgi:hypothetical protein